MHAYRIDFALRAAFEMVTFLVRMIRWQIEGHAVEILISALDSIFIICKHPILLGVNHNSFDLHFDLKTRRLSAQKS
jgi:hypothetical protein